MRLDLDEFGKFGLKGGLCVRKIARAGDGNFENALARIAPPPANRVQSACDGEGLRLGMLLGCAIFPEGIEHIKRSFDAARDERAKQNADAAKFHRCWVLDNFQLVTGSGKADFRSMVARQVHSRAARRPTEVKELPLRAISIFPFGGLPFREAQHANCIRGKIRGFESRFLLR